VKSSTKSFQCILSPPIVNREWHLSGIAGSNIVLIHAEEQINTPKRSLFSISFTDWWFCLLLPQGLEEICSPMDGCLLWMIQSHAFNCISEGGWWLCKSSFLLYWKLTSTFGTPECDRNVNPKDTWELCP
jgi:hypothetical protein